MQLNGIVELVSVDFVSIENRNILVKGVIREFRFFDRNKVHDVGILLGMTGDRTFRYKRNHTSSAISIEKHFSYHTQRPGCNSSQQ